MKQSQIEKLVKNGQARSVVSRDSQPRQVVVSSSRLRVAFLKGKQDGKTNN